MTVLMLCQEADAPADGVVTELTGRGVPVFRCDTSWFPQRLTLTAELVGSRWQGSLSTEHRAVELADIRSIWYRDPTAFRFPPELTAVERAYAHREARLGLGGILASLDTVLWANNPNRAADSMFKPLQLATAAACGLTVPSTVITNDPVAVRRFAGRIDGGVVQKSLGPTASPKAANSRSPTPGGSPTLTCTISMVCVPPAPKSRPGQPSAPTLG